MCVATATDEIYAAHLAAFERLKSAAPGVSSARSTRALAATAQHPLPHPSRRRLRGKKKVMRAIQRWHPDKFTANFGGTPPRGGGTRRHHDARQGVSASVIELRQVYN